MGINHRLKRINTDFNLNYSVFSLTTDFADLHGFFCYTARLQGNQGYQWLKLTLMLAEL